MAPQKNNFNQFLSVSPNFLNQILFGVFLTLIFLVVGYALPISLFLGVLGGLAVGWLTTANKSSPQSDAIASSEGIDAGLKYWLFFLLGFVFLGYKPSVSILLGSLAGIGGGWLIAWWKSKEETRTQIPDELTDETQLELPPTPTVKRRIRKPIRRYRRSSDNSNWPQFWRR
ncbi:MAG: hypothetical protein KME28_18845 [Pelatocladus maniniholoensis HA4357-MV3]|uniref:Uncharacterized protein n=1 Tax=Pelatocladus maniniholoensis HA4357-MV3 TaxID=1117104 RepID=A0A9E3HA71_9NOST|nr:hypothetical protein [Pelatocladus maniniholoensis HA4357-MV3]BAZ65270.1 hypothetical protein NIES4106_00050 [Fischerella sp. NIES-4106]